MQLLEIETLKLWQRASASPTERPIAGISKLGLPILFVDSRAELSASTLHSIPSNTIGVKLSRTLDGILQITGVLQYLHTIESIYIVGQEEGDCFWLGNACIRTNSLHRYHKYLKSWGECHPTGKVPIWLCGDSTMIQTMGHTMTQQLHQLTDCPVVAVEWEIHHPIPSE